MTSKLKCPVCGAGEVLEFPDRTFACDSEYCKSYEETDTTTYDLLIQAKQDLEIARQALKEISFHYQDELDKPTAPAKWFAVATKMCDYADKALEQIEHKE